MKIFGNNYRIEWGLKEFKYNVFAWLQYHINAWKKDYQIDKTLKALHIEATKPFHEVCGSQLIVQDYATDDEGYCKECDEWLTLW